MPFTKASLLDGNPGMVALTLGTAVDGVYPVTGTVNVPSSLVWLEIVSAKNVVVTTTVGTELYNDATKRVLITPTAAGLFAFSVEAADAVTDTYLKASANGCAPGVLTVPAITVSV